ncbi:MULTISPECIES: SufE family protein [Aeromonas]|uniref:SufE family protein n=1 Tax=Aeromonas TaxID=642 RepID=UPI0019202E8E|nr:MULTISPECIES: SufE family protein [Aeromonas]MBL0681088.1 SufE family protein [Aeromonas dhakensis]MDX7808776.1 SufE family protein [Aeromonas caviae]UNU89982.1 SufE family protein [Aeromonas dhakensis]
MNSLATYTRIGLEPDADTIRQQFAAASGWENQYRLIIQLGKLLPTLPAEWQQEEHRLKGCESQAWLKGEKSEDGNWHFACDSDARIVRGLIVIVLAALNHQSADTIQAFDMDAYFSELGLEKHLSPSRGNGLRAIVFSIREQAV